MNGSVSLETSGTKAKADPYGPDAADRVSPEPRGVSASPWLRIAAVLVSALLLTLASPPVGWGWLAWLAPASFFWALLAWASAHRQSGEKPVPALAFLAGPWSCGFLWGFLFLLLLVPWFAAFTPIGFPVAAVYWGLIVGAVAFVTARLVRRCAAEAAPLILASGWTLGEWLRAQGVLGFPWGTLSVTQYRYLPVLQVLDLCGAYGLTFLMALFAGSFASLAAPRYRHGGARWGAVTVAALLLCLARGEWLLHAPVPPSPSVRVGLVQESTSRVSAGAEVVCDSPLPDYAAATRDAVAHGAELVVWPESACVADLAHQPMTRSYAARALAGTKAHLLAGSFVVDPASGEDTNSAVMVSPDGAVLGQYAKVLIVPFGEYLPARPLLGWTPAIGLLPRDLKAGAAFDPLPWTRGGVGASICYESAFGSVSRAFVARGANLLAVLTSDGWAGRDAVGLQHVAFAPLRAVEERRSVARAAATGISQLIDPYGRVLKSTPMFQHGVAVADLPLREDRTLYSYLGDWPVGLSLLILLAALVTSRRRATADGTMP